MLLPTLVKEWGSWTWAPRQRNVYCGFGLVRKAFLDLGLGFGGKQETALRRLLVLYVAV